MCWFKCVGTKFTDCTSVMYMLSFQSGFLSSQDLSVLANMRFGTSQEPINAARI